MYELRHSELRLEVKEEVTELKAQINTLGGKMDALSIQVARRGIDAWKLLAVSLMNFMLGGGLVAVLNYTHVLK